jgi:hypothetical protein
MAFDITDVLSSDSYLKDFYNSLENYTRSNVSPLVYFPLVCFRYVDQSDENIQRQMQNYINDLVTGVDAIVNPPAFFWLRDFKTFVSELSEGSPLTQIDFND